MWRTLNRRKRVCSFSTVSRTYTRPTWIHFGTCKVREFGIVHHLLPHSPFKAFSKGNWKGHPNKNLFSSLLLKTFWSTTMYTAPPCNSLSDVILLNDARKHLFRLMRGSGHVSGLVFFTVLCSLQQTQWMALPVWFRFQAALSALKQFSEQGLDPVDGTLNVEKGSLEKWVKTLCHILTLVAFYDLDTMKAEPQGAHITALQTCS